MLTALLAISAALAQAPAENAALPPLSYRASVGANWIFGNLDQFQLSASGRLSTAAPRYGNDLILDGYRLWVGLPGASGLTQTGDDASVSTIPYVTLRDRLHLLGVGHYSYSQLRQVDGRVLAGAALGIVPFRDAVRSLRLGLGAFYERTAFSSETLNLNVSQNGDVRTVLRTSLVVDGRYRPRKSAFSARGHGWLHINPADPVDLRASLDGAVGFHIIGPLSAQLSVVATYNSVVVQGIDTIDLRSTVGLQVEPPKKEGRPQ